ncbi:hypothetical protein N5W20_07520 [Candidatus Kirkpatrickella diaphorinae]|uniref:Uncharacterized protein n=1 Tax=Candidatus Kirkpatrickella diaphorinae TaxID=2984322 RepID=A0ABY6GJU9_9PROT|nr:hypothetical protein [Candidatus Kirkpatrickella diaphorinae]UYH50941.1 hypothetical protein N5W20_07520 [Candidatus Kirkpatrickella diaphorinae]
MQNLGFSLRRYWLLDYFGRFVDLDLLRDRLNTINPAPGRVPGIFMRAPNPLPERFEAMLEKAVSLPMPVPIMKVQISAGNLATFLSHDGAHPRYMRSTPDFHIHMDAEHPSEWEHFSLLTDGFLRACATLMHGDRITIASETGEELGPMRLTEGHQIMIGPHAYPIRDNMEVIESFDASLPLREPIPLDLVSGEETRTVTVSAKQVEQSATP